MLQLSPEGAGVSWLKFHCLSGGADYITGYQILRFQVRPAADGDDFSGGSILLAGLLAHLLDMCCGTGE